METYGALFSNFDITVAQVLLTATDLATPEKAGYVSSKLERILEEPRGLPIINENDSVAIKGVDLWPQRHVVTHGLPR